MAKADRKLTRLERIAHHEAGHAVVARLLGVPLAHVALFPTDHSDDPTATAASASYLARNAAPPVQLAAIETDIKVSLAGPCADRQRDPSIARIRFSNGLIPDRATRKHKGWATDLFNTVNHAVHAVLLKAGKDTSDLPAGEGKEVSLRTAEVREIIQMIDRLQGETQTLVNKNWPAIVRVANALLQHRILTENDVDALIAARDPKVLTP